MEGPADLNDAFAVGARRAASSSKCDMLSPDGHTGTNALAASKRWAREMGQVGESTRLVIADDHPLMRRFARGSVRPVRGCRYCRGRILR
jgi:hypothetical protein